MKEKDMQKKWLNRDIEDWGGVTSDEYKEFSKNYRNVLRNIGKEIGFSLHSFNNNHYCFSAVMQSSLTNQFYYIFISDVRYFKNEWANNILFRTMEHDHDWTGGSNRFSSLEKLSENLLYLDKQILRNLEKENARQVIYQAEPQKSKYEDFEQNYA